MPRELPMADRPRPERADAARNRARILDAARRLFREGGDPPSIDTVAAAAGVGKATVFRRFGDRAGLLEAMLDEPARTFTDAFLHGPPPVGPGAPPAERLEAFVDTYLTFVAAETPLLRALDALPRRSPMLGVLYLHVRILVSQLLPGPEAPTVSGMLMAAISPAAISRQLEEGVTLEELQVAARALLRGLTCEAIAGDGARPGM